MTGYTRNDVANNIAANKTASAADIDGEFDAIVAAFDETTGHTHDGTSDEGAPITVIGPSQDYVGGASDFSPKADSTYSLGTTSIRWSDGFLDALTVGGDITVDGTVDGRDVASDGTKLDTIETSADVTDTTNVAAAGALMDSEVTSLSGIKTLTVPDSTTISAFGATLVDDADASEARTTLGLGTMSTETASDYATLTGSETLTNKTVNLSNNTFTVDGSEEIGFKRTPVVSTSGKTLATSDVGKMVVATGTITIPNSTFSAGDIVTVFNNTASDLTLTCSIGTAYIAGIDTDEASITVSTRGFATIFFISGTICVVTGNVR